MPSSRNRKKGKGKERKARQEEDRRVKIYNKWQGLARGEVTLARGLVENIQCNHGLDSNKLPDISHPVSRFMHTYFGTEDHMRDAIQQHIEVWSNDNYRKMAADILTNIGANWLSSIEKNTGTLAITILLLENFSKTNEYYSTAHQRDVAIKKRDLSIETLSAGMSKRDLLKFYRKRMNCKCLKKMHLEERKTQPKLGECNNCEEVKERALLMVCSRCMIEQYCSKECQVAASPEHREDCNDYVEAHEMVAAMANDNDTDSSDDGFEQEDPNEPKRNMSSFFIYANATRADVKTAYPDATCWALAKILSVNFKALPADERAYWDEKAAEDEVRYVTEMAAYEAAKRR